MSSIDDDLQAELHWSDRAAHLLSLEEHLQISANLARAIFEMLDGTDEFIDDRSKYAFVELASSISDHASAARYVYHAQIRDRCDDLNNAIRQL